MGCAAVLLAYGLGGLIAGQVFGLTGIDVLAEKLRSVPRVHVATFVHDADEQMLSFARRYAFECHIVLVGQSAGGNGAVRVAHRLLPEAIPVKLLIAFDPPDRSVLPLLPLPANVEAATLYRQNGILGGGRLKRAPGNSMTASLENRTVNVDHIPMARYFHDEILRDVRRLAK